MTTGNNYMKLGMFYWPCGHHIAAWRHPDGVADSGSNISHLIELAKLSERGLFDMFFMADSVTFWRGELDSMVRGAACDGFNIMPPVFPAGLTDVARKPWPHAPDLVSRREVNSTYLNDLFSGNCQLATTDQVPSLNFKS